MVNLEFLKSQGFHRDETCPNGVNRWEKTVKNGVFRDYYVSITLSVDGSHTIYGILNFFYADSNTSSNHPVEYISEHRKFDLKALTEEEYHQFVDRKYKLQ